MSQRHTEQNQPDHPRIIDLKEQRQVMINAKVRFCIEEQAKVYQLDSVQKFLPSLHAKEAEAEAEAWAKEYGIWLPGISQDTNTMGAYLNSNAISVERLADINKFYLVLFYVDDMFGNDRQANKTPEELAAFKQQINNIGKWLGYDAPFTPTGDLERATYDIFEKIKGNSDPEWFTDFKQVCIEHLLLAVENQNSNHTQQIHTVDSFTETRIKIAGMYTSIMLDQYAINKYVSKEDIKKYGYTEKIKSLYFDSSVVCSYFNELFSFEREVIDDNTDYNLIAILMLNDDDLSLYESVTAAVNLTNFHIERFSATKNDLHKQVEKRAAKMEAKLKQSHKNMVKLSKKEEEELDVEYEFLVNMIRHVDGIEDFINAAWFWQVITQRYEREDTIFHETRPDYRANLANQFQLHWSMLKGGKDNILEP